MAGTDNSYNEYLAKVRGSESGGKQYAKNPRSTASGLYQFTESTWKGLGYDWKDRFNPTLQNQAMAKLTNSNSNYLKSRLGITPTDADLYGAHFLGPQGYASVYNKPDNTPLSSVLTSGAMSANPFLAGKTTGFLKNWLSKKMNVKVSPSEFSGDSYSYGVDTSLNLPMNTGEYQTAPEMSETTSKEDLEAEQAKAELLEKQREKEFLAEVQARQDQDSERRYQQEQQVPEQEYELDPSYYQVPQIELPNYEAIKYQQAQNQAQIPQDEFQLGGKKYSEQNGRLVVTTKVVNTPNGPRYYQAKSPDYNFSIELTDAKRVGDSIPKANLDPHIIEALNRRQDGGEIDLQYKDGGSIPQRYKNMGFTHVGQKKAGDGQKKWKVLAKKGDKYKVVQGGYRGMKDFSQHGSKKRQDNFWSRMGGRDSAKANDPFSPLYWHKRLGKWEDGGEIEGEVECTNCGWSWDKSESTEKDMYNCHKCGGKSTGELLSQFQQGGKKEDKPSLGAGKFNTTTGKVVIWGTPEYEKAYNRGEVLSEDGVRSEVTLDGGKLEDVVIKGKKRKKGFWEQSRDAYLKEHQDDGLFGAIGSVVTYPLGLAQQAMMYGLTDKVQKPSEVVGFKNNEGWFANPSSFGKNLTNLGVDIVTDPANWIGLGELSTVGRLTKAEALAKLAKIETRVAPELMEGARTNGLTFKGTPRKYPINNSQRAVTEDVDRLFEEFPELAKTGSKEEYIKYLETIQPETTQPGIFYRGSNQSHNPSEWMPNPSGGNNLGEGFYFTPDPIKTQRYGKEMKALLDIKDPTYTSLRLNSNGLMVPSGMKAKDIVGEGSAAISIQNPNRDLFTEMGSRGEGYMHKYKGPLDEQGFPAATRPYESNPNYTEYSTVDELVVPDNSQIHVLGSDADKELFKNYINNNKKQDGGELLSQFQQGGAKEVKSALGAGKFNTTTGDTVVWGTPEYEAAYNRGEVVTDKGGRSEVTLEGGKLDEVVVQGKKRNKGFWKQSRDKYLKEHQDDGLLGAIGSVATYPLAVGQHALTYGTTGKVQDPDEAWGYNTNEGWFDSAGAFGRNLADAGLNIGADPSNLVGAGIVTKGKGFINALTKGKALSKGIARYGDDLIQASKAAGKIKLPTYSNTYRWQADVVPESLVNAGRSLTPEQQSLTGSWYTHDVNQLPFYMRTRPGSGNVNVSRLSDTKIANLESNMSDAARGMSGKTESVAASNTSLPGELILPKSLKDKVKQFKFDVNPSEYPLPSEQQELLKDPSFIGSPYHSSILQENTSNIVNPILEAQYQPIMGVPRKYFPFKEGGEAVEQFQQGGNFDPNSARDMWVAKTGMSWGEAKNLGYTDGSRESNIELLDQLRDKNFKIKSNKKMDTENDNEFFPQVPINPIWNRKPPVTKKSVTAPVRKAKKDIKKVDPLSLVINFATGNMGNTQNLENGVITDKRSNTNYVVENGVVTRTFPVLTALNPDVNVNDKGVVYLDSHPESRGTPRGTYLMNPKADIYGEPGFRMDPVAAFGEAAPKAKDIATHITYPGEFKQRNPLYAQESKNRYASYGCVNCRKPDLKYLTDRFKKGDTTIVIDSNNRKDADFLGRKLFSRR